VQTACPFITSHVLWGAGVTNTKDFCHATIQEGKNETNIMDADCNALWNVKKFPMSCRCSECTMNAFARTPTRVAKKTDASVHFTGVCKALKHNLEER
jgi:hypothetical protein